MPLSSASPSSKRDRESFFPNSSEKRLPISFAGGVSFVALALIRGYQLLMRPMLAGSGSCRFVPSCSEYATESIHVHGALKGSWLALKRVLRCHPFGGHGLDPVP